MKPKSLIYGPTSVILLTAGLLHAATTTLDISGVVTALAEVTVTPTALATALPLEEGAVDQKIATINELSNNLLGYSVTLSSANAVAEGSATAVLLREGGDGEEPIYTLTYGGVPVVFVGGEAIVTALGTLTGSSGVNKDLNITIAPGQVFTAGTYGDTLTFTLTNN